MKSPTFGGVAVWCRRPFAWLLLVFALLAPTEPLGAQPIRVLFVGNSFTHGKFRPVLQFNNQSVVGGVIDENFGLPPGNARAETTFGEPGPYGGIPGLVRRFTAAAGLNYEVHLATISGKGLDFHAANALAVIAQAQWDVVVLQDLSTGPIPPARGGTPTVFIAAVNQLEQAIHAQNASAQVFLYQTWARADMTYLPTGAYFGQPIETMGNDLRDGYQAALAQNANLAGIIPAGEAWLRAIGPVGSPGIALRNPYVESGLNLWGADHYHPSVHGAYLSALVIFGRVTGLDPTTLLGSDPVAAELGIASTAAAALQQVARDQLLGARPSPRRSRPRAGAK